MTVNIPVNLLLSLPAEAYAAGIYLCGIPITWKILCRRYRKNNTPTHIRDTAESIMTQSWFWPVVLLVGSIRYLNDIAKRKTLRAMGFKPPSEL